MFLLESEDMGKAAEHQAYFLLLKIGQSSWTKREDIFLLQCFNKKIAISGFYAIKEQRYLTIVLDFALLFECDDKVCELLCLLINVLMSHCTNGSVVFVLPMKRRTSIFVSTERAVLGI